ncbi:MAG TPA: hypothetical protein VKD71_13285 [Gemmataceae bacterium]|nr:hypothetical protein [Gemmataceae bacterium]
MARDFMSYWRPDTLDDEIEAGGLLQHAASNQYGRVEVGDTVWLVTTRSGQLRLIGRIVVGQITDQDGAARALGSTKLWQADYHILAADGTAREVADLDTQRLAPQLRFRSANGSDRLTIDAAGLVSAQQLQTMRLLAPNSAELLSGVLEHCD